MSRVNAADVGLRGDVRADKVGPNAGFDDLHVAIAATERRCPRCGRAMIKHGSFSKEMSHVVGDTPCRLTVKVPRHRCKGCGATASEDVPFASALSPKITDVLEERVLQLLSERKTITEVARACDVAYDTVRLVIDGAHVRQPRLPSILLMDEVHAYGYRDAGTGKVTCVFWACAYDGSTGRLIDVMEGRDEQAVNAWFRQFDEEERRAVRHFCRDMYDTYINAAKRWLGRACISVDRFHVAKAGVSHADKARCRIRKGAGNGAEIKRRARKLVVNKGKRTREHPGEAWATREREATCRMPGFCDTKHSHLRQVYLVMQPCYAWQDTRWTDRYACEKAPGNWIQKAAGLEVPEMRSFAHTVAAYRQYLITGTVTHVNSARAEAVNDKIKELKRKGRGFGGFAETRRRLLIAFGGPDAVEGATARMRRREAQRAALDSTAPRRKRKKKR